MMPIPPFNEQGLLPEGIHDCTFLVCEQTSEYDEYIRLFQRVREYRDQRKGLLRLRL